MTIVRWDPFRELVSLSNRLDRVLSEAPRFGRDTESYGNWIPPVDIFEKNDELVLRAELPGMDREDIDLRVENGVLTLTGERGQDAAVTEESAHRRERVYGSFSRSFTLPASVDAGKIAASYKDGILEVVLPKSEASKPKRVEIRVA